MESVINQQSLCATKIKCCIKLIAEKTIIYTILGSGTLYMTLKKKLVRVFEVIKGEYVGISNEKCSTICSTLP